jgi:choline dehydrogenase-like flavoprotein
VSTDHGTSGPLHVGLHPNAPISDAVMESFKSLGFPYHADMFTNATPPHGCGHALRSIYGGIRSTAADFITKDNRRENITILTDTIVDKVLIEEIDRRLKAIGAVVTAKSGERNIFRVRKEVIVSGGAYCSPAILLRSGIGAKNEVEQLGIPCKVDLPGVGKNLMDQYVTLFCTCVGSSKSKRLQSTCTLFLRDR